MTMKSGSSNYRMDVPTAGRSAAWAGIVAIAFFLIMGVLDIRQANELAFVFAIIAGWMYATHIYKKIIPSYLEAAGGGALSGAIYAVLVAIVGLLLAQILSDSGSLARALRDLTATYSMDDLANQVVTSALLGALGGAGVVLLRTQKID
ncbi:MAG: hypothetical protein KIT46_01775 [Anaerolineales bacterium]|nr:hypothetical protein [Anaerolineales bacterium]